MRRHGSNDTPTGRLERVMFVASGYVALALAVIVVVLS